MYDKVIKPIQHILRRKERARSASAWHVDPFIWYGSAHATPEQLAPSGLVMRVEVQGYPVLAVRVQWPGGV